MSIDALSAGIISTDAASTEIGCGGGHPFAALSPARQAEFLAMLTQDARLLRFSLKADDAATRTIGARLQRALEDAMDAEEANADHARQQLESALEAAREAKMGVSAELGEVDVDGVLGTMKMRVLTAVLGAPQSA